MTYTFPPTVNWEYSQADFQTKFFAALDKNFSYEASKIISYLEEQLAGKTVSEYISYGVKARNLFIEYMGGNDLSKALILANSFDKAVVKALTAILVVDSPKFTLDQRSELLRLEAEALTISELRYLLKNKELSTDGTRSVLLDRLLEAEENMLYVDYDTVRECIIASSNVWVPIKVEDPLREYRDCESGNCWYGRNMDRLEELKIHRVLDLNGDRMVLCCVCDCEDARARVFDKHIPDDGEPFLIDASLFEVDLHLKLLAAAEKIVFTSKSFLRFK